MLAALLSIAIGAAVLLGMTTISRDIPRQMEREFRSYGANMILVAADGGEMPRKDVERAVALLPKETLLGAASSRYRTVRSDRQPYTLAGTMLDQVRKMNPWWRVTGDWPERNDEILIGADVAEFTRSAPGKTLELSGRGEDGTRFSREVTVSGVVRTGGVEDGFLFMELSALDELDGGAGAVEITEISLAASTSELERQAARIREEEPGLAPQLVKRVTRSEAAVLSRLQALVYLVTGIVLILTMICVATTMMTVVLERRKEIGLKKALGAENSTVASEFLGEGLCLALAGGAAGVALGWFFAQTISMNVFGRTVFFDVRLIPLTLAVSVGVTGLACLIPVRNATQVEPALVLRGE
jgi:putative ABC transport system permease protein